MKKSNIKLISLRKELLQCDKELISVLKKRFSITKKIGTLKKKHKMEVTQTDFWKKNSVKREKWATKAKLDKNMVKAIFEQIHTYSLIQQKRNTDK